MLVMFQRARSEDQREVRRQTILDVTATMLDEMPVAEVTLNELSRRACFAKSNVLRYFESREAILLELLDRAWQAWLVGLAEQLAAEIEPARPVRERGDRFAAVFARSLAGQRVFCDLLSAQASVLERNVSTEVVVRYKRAMLERATTLVTLTRTHLPELDDSTDPEGGLFDSASAVCAGAVMLAGTIWAHTQPSPSTLAAYEADPALSVLRLDFTDTLSDTLATLISGYLARAAAGQPADR